MALVSQTSLVVPAHPCRAEPQGAVFLLILAIEFLLHRKTKAIQSGEGMFWQSLLPTESDLGHLQLVVPAHPCRAEPLGAVFLLLAMEPVLHRKAKVIQSGEGMFWQSLLPTESDLGHLQHQEVHRIRPSTPAYL